MNDKEFKKLHRRDLIEIIYQYQCREQELRKQNEALQKELEDRRIKLNSAGSIAEAALALNDVFAAAQKAADQYLFEIKSMHKEIAESCGADLSAETSQAETPDLLPRTVAQCSQG